MLPGLSQYLILQLYCIITLHGTQFYDKLHEAVTRYTKLRCLAISTRNLVLRT